MWEEVVANTACIYWLRSVHLQHYDIKVIDGLTCLSPFVSLKSSLINLPILIYGPLLECQVRPQNLAVHLTKEQRCDSQGAYFVPRWRNWGPTKLGPCSVSTYKSEYVFQMLILAVGYWWWMIMNLLLNCADFAYSHYKWIVINDIYLGRHWWYSQKKSISFCLRSYVLHASTNVIISSKQPPSLMHTLQINWSVICNEWVVNHQKTRSWEDVYHSSRS